MPFLILFIIVLCNSCTKDNSVVLNRNSGHQMINFSMRHFDQGNSAMTDTMIYRTRLGNDYLISDLQYFISNLKIHYTQGKWTIFHDKSAIRYIDLRNPSTHKWETMVDFNSGDFDSIAFTFGIGPEDNTSYRFINPPERDMAWPEILGGGYHYMKMNLKWKKDGWNESLPFMFHLGRGQMYEGSSMTPDSIIGYIDNSFNVRLPINTEMNEEYPAGLIIITMNIDRWFDGADSFDFSAYPMGIMQNQSGMFRAVTNGHQAFTASKIVK